MSDMELIMQLAKLEEQEEDEPLESPVTKEGTDGAESCSEITKTDEFELNDCITNSDDSSIVMVNDDMRGGTDTSSPIQAPVGVIHSGVKNTNFKLNTELQDLADLEKELGLDDLQLFLDSSSPSLVPCISPSFKSPDAKKSDKSGMHLYIHKYPYFLDVERRADF